LKQKAVKTVFIRRNGGEFFHQDEEGKEAVHKIIDFHFFNVLFPCRDRRILIPPALFLFGQSQSILVPCHRFPPHPASAYRQAGSPRRGEREKWGGETYV
jgi:hypothetical protein